MIKLPSLKLSQVVLSLLIAACCLPPSLFGIEHKSRLNLNGYRFRPFLDLSRTYDSNANLDTLRTKDYSTEGLLGLNVFQSTNQLSLESQIWANMVRHDDLENLDSDGYGDYVGIAYQPKEKMELTLDQKFAHLTNYKYDLLHTSTGLVSPIDRTERFERDVFSFRAGLETALSDKTDLSLTYRYGFTNYNDETAFDSQKHLIGGDVSYHVTDKTAAFIYGDYQYLDGDGNEKATTVYSLRGGLKSLATDKFTFRTGAGAMFSKVAKGKNLGFNSETSFNYFARGEWRATEKILLVASARNYMKVASDAQNNARRVTEFSLGSDYDINEAFNLNVTGAYSIDRYVNDVTVGGQTGDQKQQSWMLRGRLTYTPPNDYLALYVDAQYGRVDDNFDNGYEQVQLIVGLKLWY